MAGRFKVNKVSVDIQNYLYYLRGVKKAGKTTMFRDLILELFGTPEKGLLIAIKDEVGYKALDELQAEHVDSWQAFEKLVEDLIKNKAEYGIEFLAIDTVDELVDMAIQRAIKLSVMETGKPCKSLNSAFGGYGAGRARVTTMIKESLAALKKSGYGIFSIGHTKLRTVKEKGMTEDEGYQFLTSNLSSDYDAIFADIFDVIATINVEKVIEENRLVGTKRYLYFRNDGFVDCGSRFKGMPERVELGGNGEDENLAKPFIKAIQEGIRNSISKPITDKEFEAMHRVELQEKEEKSARFIEEYTEPTKEELVNEIKSKFVVASTETKAALTKVLEANNIKSLKNVEDVEVSILKEILEVLN